MAYAQMRDAGATYAQARATAPPLYDAGYSTAPGYQQGGMRAPISQTMLSDDPTGGLGFLSGVDGLFIQERVELFEAFTGCDTNNVYHLTPIPAGALPAVDPIPPEWIAHFREQADRRPMLKAREESECAERVCCPLYRSFRMDFRDGTGATFFTVHRPFRCTLHAPCFLCNPQELSLVDAHGRPAASATEEFRPCWFCARSFVAADESGVETYRMRTSECGTSVGNNVCAPSCCNASYDVDVFDARETTVVARATNAWPGWNCAGATDRSNVVLRFPKDASARERASLVAAVTLVEFAHFEWKKNDNEAGGPAAAFI